MLWKTENYSFTYNQMLLRYERQKCREARAVLYISDQKVKELYAYDCNNTKTKGGIDGNVVKPSHVI